MIKITADSTCDLSPSILKELDITLSPLYIHSGEHVYRDGVDITPAEVFSFAGTQGKLCKTGAINIEEYKDFFAELSPLYEAVIHINLGLNFSICHQNASLAAQAFHNVYAVNSENLSSGSGHIVMDAALMARSGMDAPGIISKLHDTIPLVDASFMIDRLDYLHKGGRCSGLEAIGARLLGIKPCIEVTGGAMHVGKKYRGNYDLCLEKYVSDRLCQIDDIDKSRVFVTYTTCPENTLARVMEIIDDCADFDEVIVTRAGCTISSHCGPNTLGVLFKRLRHKI